MYFFFLILILHQCNAFTIYFTCICERFVLKFSKIGQQKIIGNNKCLKMKEDNANFGKIVKSTYMRIFSTLNLNAKNYWIY